MRIVAPKDFWHAGNLSNKDASSDPRSPQFPTDLVDVDLRGCDFVRPAAALWCAVYPLLAVTRVSDCRLLVPENMGVSVYLKSVRLFEVLKESGVDVDDRGIRGKGDLQVVLPLTRFTSEHEVEELADVALTRLADRSLGAANLRPLVTEIFAELAMNAVQHSASRIGAVGLIQFYETQSGSRFVCAVADGGIGIRRSLARNPELHRQVPYDWVAIELALRERVSGTGIKTRGIGLYGVAEDMGKAGPKRTTLFPGTLAYASIPT